MHEYDVALKRILTRPGSAVLAALLRATGLQSVEGLRWLNVELPKVNNLRVDQLGRLPDGQLIHIDCQTQNDGGIAMRMAEYFFGIWRLHGGIPLQIVLYIGEKPMRMKNTIAVAGLTYRFHLIDIRELDGEPLLASPNLSDNVVAVLTRLGSQPGTVRRILERIANSKASQRGEALTELYILAGLRGLHVEIEREVKTMPIVEDKLLKKIIAPQIRQGLEQGRIEGQMEILLSQVAKRFGRVTPNVRRKLATLKPDQLKSAGLRLLDANRIEDLFAR